MAAPQPADRIPTLVLASATLMMAFFAPPPGLAVGNCPGTSTGRIPLIDLPPALYQGFEGGLYPSSGKARPIDHEGAADRLARVRLLDGTGAPDALNGRIVMLSIGMSNTTQEYQRFMQLAVADTTRNRAVVLVDGAQGGWSADKVSDPTQNAMFWSTVSTRLSAAGVTPAQVQAIWLKEADAGPTLLFPEDARKLQQEIETIIRDIKTRFPNASQLYLSNRIYAGYATGPLNPEPFAYQSGFAVKWIVQDQIEGLASLNFDPGRGPVEAPWLSWGPYLWADGLVPRSDGLTWSCDDLGTDGTHPSDSGRLKVAQMLLSFLKSDAVATRWFGDCNTADPSVFAPPPEVLGDRVTSDGVVDTVSWDDLDVVAGQGTSYDVVTGRLSDLRATRDFSAAICAAGPLATGPAPLPAAGPARGDAIYYLIRGRNSCGDGSYGRGTSTPDPRALLDASSPCP